ncbi:unnamed protein product [Blepharisma stoltei]|uniref:FLYWCH-type domain-containing protein n=1 Tax=Blepharisma stoltei TaxID=1481888 RepID=A0AAU9JLD0_9CILI|nr:unnamed protein product [Blepharisma stoltei]
MQQEQDIEVMNYTYYRHSAPKGVIYYRCSDRHCPARLHYDTAAKEISLKNNHLNPAIHRPSNSKRAITTQQLLKMPDHKMRAPVVVTQAIPSQKVKHEEELNLPKKRERLSTMINSMPQEIYMVRFYVDNLEIGNLFAREIIDNCIGHKVCCFTNGYQLNFANVQELKVTVEVECPQDQTSRVILFMNQIFGYDIDHDIFKKL